MAAGPLNGSAHEPCLIELGVECLLDGNKASPSPLENVVCLEAITSYPISLPSPADGDLGLYSAPTPT